MYQENKKWRDKTKKTRKMLSTLLAFCMLLTFLPGMAGMAAAPNNLEIPAAYSALDDFLASASEHQFKGYSIDDIRGFIAGGGQIYQELRVQYENAGTMTYKVPVQDGEIEYLTGLQNRSVQPYSVCPFPVTKIRDSGWPDKDSLVLILLGDGFSAEQYGTWPNPAQHEDDSFIEGQRLCTIL